MPCDAVLLIAFGGPERAEDVRPFLANVLRGRPVPPERVETVVRHYELIGGRSPLNELTFRQADALREMLRREGPALPVYVGMRNWKPYLRDTLDAMARDGVRHAAGFILAAQQNDSGWHRYRRDVLQAREQVGAAAPEVTFTEPWFAHPLFVAAVSDRLSFALGQLPAERRAAARIVFTAHSIPVAMAAQDPYERQIREGAEAVAAQIGLSAFAVAYQSRSGSPREPWLEPDIREFLRGEAARGTRDVVVAPIGFVCDHVEVVYDLDIEARAVAESLGVGFARAGTVNDHPAFVRMMAGVIRAHVAGG